MDEYVTKAVHELEIGRINDEQSRQNKRLDIVEGKIESLAELTASVKLLAANMESMAKEQAKITTRLEALEDEPAENWKKLVGYVLGAIVAGLIGFLLRGVGI